MSGQKMASSSIAKRSEAPIRRQKRLSTKEVELLKRTVAKGVTDDEFSLFLWVCKKHKLDPMTRQLHCVRRFTKKHHQDEKGIWVGGEQMVIQMGIDGYRSLAGRDHDDFGGCDEPEFEFDKPGDKVPTVARIRLWKKGLEHPIVGVAYWNEYAPTDLTDGQAFMWRKMPKHMLAKCAEALALRKGYPELADIYTNEEMSQADDEHTPEGRQIVQEAATGSVEAAKNVAKRKIKEHSEGKVIEVKPEPAKESETITITPWKEGRVSLSGNGLAIVKAELSPELLADLDIKLKAKSKITHMPASKVFEFIDRAAKCNVVATLAEQPVQGSLI